MTSPFPLKRQSLITEIDRIKGKLIKPYSDLTEFYRLATSQQRVIPDYLIIGVQKGGTTSLYKYLKMHPKIKSAFRKEIHFFDRKFDKSLSWYRSHFPFKENGYIVGEATPDYIFNPYAAKRVARLLPSIKLIVLLRNPIDRALSHYYHSSRHSAYRKKVTSFEDALAIEETITSSIDFARLQQNEEIYTHSNIYNLHEKYSYLRRGIYINQIKPWVSLFPREQLLILRSEDLYSNPQKVYKACLNFLGVQHYEPNDFFKFNASRGYSKMNAETREKLIQYFKPFNDELSKYLNIELDWNV